MSQSRGKGMVAVIVVVSIICIAAGLIFRHTNESRQQSTASSNPVQTQRVPIDNIPIDRDVPPPNSDTEALKLFTNIVNRPGIYSGQIVTWQYSIPEPDNPDDCGAGGCRMEYNLRLNQNISNRTVDSIFYYGVVFYKNGTELFNTNNCSDYSHADWDACVIDAANRYLKAGTMVESNVVCGNDSGCYINTINIL